MHGLSRSRVGPFLSERDLPCLRISIRRNHRAWLGPPLGSNRRLAMHIILRWSLTVLTLHRSSEIWLERSCGFPATLWHFFSRELHIIKDWSFVIHLAGVLLHHFSVFGTLSSGFAWFYPQFQLLILLSQFVHQTFIQNDDVSSVNKLFLKWVIFRFPLFLSFLGISSSLFHLNCGIFNYWDLVLDLVESLFGSLSSCLCLVKVKN